MRRTRALMGSLALSAFSLLLMAAQQSSSPPDKQGPLFKVDSQLVQVFFTVTDGQRRVTELSGQEFSLTEDGRATEIGHVDTAEVPLYVALLLDSSESMRDSLVTVQQAAASFVEALRPADRVVLVRFNSDIRPVPQVTDDRTPILQAIRNAQASGGTKLYDALLFAMKQLGGKYGRKAIVTFSDGEDTSNTSSLDVVLNAAARHGFPIFTIGAGSGLQKDNLRQVLRKIAEVNSGRSYFVEDSQKLRAAFDEVLAELRSAYVLNYYTQVPADGRWHDIRIMTSDTRQKVHARSGFFARSGQSKNLFSRLAEEDEPNLRRRGDPGDVDPNDPASLRATAELEAAAAEAPASMAPRSVALPAVVPGDRNAPKVPVFRVETRFVEVPVLVERTGRNSLPLAEKDFRVYENDVLREVAFFSHGEGARSLTQLQNQAMTKVGATARSIGLSTDPSQSNFGRFFIVLDDLMTEPGDFLRAKIAVEKIIKEQTNPLRPVSFHLVSQSQTDLAPPRDLDQVLRSVKSAAPRSNRNLYTNDGIMSVHEAYLIEGGDASARMLAELRQASTIGAFFENLLGTVQGDASISTETIRTQVNDTARTLILENQNYVQRAIEGLRAVIGAASAEPGDYPRTVVFISGGFCLGRQSMRGDSAGLLGNIIAASKRAKARFFTIDATGLTNDEPLGVLAAAGFLVMNPHLQGLLQQHAQDWRLEKQSPLNQLAVETGGRFLNSTNDLAEAAARAFRAAGELYYLGFVSTQPADGRFRTIRVSVSEPGARVIARNGYFAGQHSSTPTPDDDKTDWRELAARAEAARKSGNLKELAENLDKLTRRFPGQLNLWFNLGVAHLQLGNAKSAVDALQRAFALAPDDRDVGVALAHAFVGAGYREAAEESLERLVRKQPRDRDLLIHLGRVYEAGGRLELAYRTYRRLLDLSRQLPLEAYLLLARTASRLGRTTEAEIFVDDYLGLGGSADQLSAAGQAAALNGSTAPEKR